MTKQGPSQPAVADPQTVSSRFSESFPVVFAVADFPLIFKHSVWEFPPTSIAAPRPPKIVNTGTGPDGLLNSVRSVGWPLFDLREEVTSVEIKESDSWGNAGEFFQTVSSLYLRL